MQRSINTLTAVVLVVLGSAASPAFAGKKGNFNGNFHANTFHTNTFQHQTFQNQVTFPKNKTFVNNHVFVPNHIVHTPFVPFVPTHHKVFFPPVIVNLGVTPRIVTRPVQTVQVIKTQTTSSADLELADVRLVDAGDATKNLGPQYRLICRNNGRDVAKFNVTVAVDAGSKLSEGAEVQTLEVQGLRKGQSGAIDVRLPATVLSMGEDARPFATMVAAVDSDDTVKETDEQNNVKILTRTAIRSLSK